jgi:Na+/H+ antiporter NhaD/arsenite permease-like protein
MPHLPAQALPDLRIFAAYAVFLGSYLVFALGKFPGLKIDRPGAAIIGAVLMFGFRILLPEDSLHFIDFSTLVLLFSMMLIVAYLHQAGFFDWITHLIVSRLKPHHLLPTIIFTSGILSAFFVNDIICLAMVPLVLTATRRLGVKPLPYLLAVATASNIGSVATITGNPQNILIGSFSGIHYVEFMFRLGPIALIGLFVDWAVIHFMSPRWGGDAVAAQALDPVKPIELSKLVKPAIVVAAVLAGFLAGFPPAMVGALGAAAMLITRSRDPRQVYEEVDWGLLVFFVGLFLLVGGAEKAGITGRLLSFADHWNLQNAGIFAVVVAMLSNIVSNVPAVMLVKSAVPGMPDPHSGWLLLAMASTLAGNLTITGSVANIIVVEQARKETEISFWDYLRVGVPVTVLTILIGFLWLWWVA